MTGRARIGFAEPSVGPEDVGEEPGILLDDGEQVLETVPPARKGTGAKKGGGPSNRTMIIGGISFMLFVLVMGGFIFMLKQKRAAQEEDTGFAPVTQQYPQPAIAAEEPRPPGTMLAPVTPIAPVGAAPITPIDPQQAPGNPQSAPASTPVAGPGMAPVQASPQIGLQAVQPSPGPVAVQVPAASPAVGDMGRGDSRGLDAKLDGLTQRLSKVESAIAALMPVVERLVHAEKDKAKVAPIAPAAPKANAPEKVATSEAAQKEAKAEPKPAAKPVVAAKTPTPAPAVKATKPGAKSDEPAAEPVPAIDTRNYSVNSVIGSRAWVVKTQGDGSEVEYSAAPGEALEGRTVVSVDGKAKRVCLDNGQCIVKR